MKHFLNRHILSLTVLDSGLITPLMAIMHRFETPGRYSATVFQGDDAVAMFNLVVNKDAPLCNIKIDVGAVDQPVYAVNPQASVLFNSPRGSGGYHVVVKALGDEAKLGAYDTRELQEGDVFMATLIRPGYYSAKNQYRATCNISVAPLRRGAIQFNPALGRGIIRNGAEPVTIECAKEYFKPQKVDVGSAQALLFTMRAPLRIRIELERLEEAGKGPQPLTHKP